MIITKLKQVETIANKLFKCAVRPVTDISATGKKGVKLIVGMRRNPAYDPALNPDDPNLPIELMQNKDLLASKTNPETADVRILWLDPGTTEQELIDNHLMKIKISLDAKTPIVKKDPTLTKLETESDADIAAKLASGADIDERYEEWDDGYEEESENTPASIDDERNEKQPVPVEEKPKPVIKEKASEEVADNNDLVIGAIEQLGKNIETLSSDMNTLNSNIGNIEERVNNIEGKPDKPKVKAKPKAK